MDDPITEYQKWKQQGQNLRAQARQAMESRFRELLGEAAHGAKKYRLDFGTTLKPPSPVTVFRFKASSRSAVKKKIAKGNKPPQEQPVAAAKTKTTKSEPKIVALKKQLAQTRRKIEAAKANGKSTKNLEDQAYEIEDALRLASHSA